MQIIPYHCGLKVSYMNVYLPKYSLLTICLIVLLAACKKNDQGSSNNNNTLHLSLATPANGSASLTSPVTLACQTVPNATTYKFAVVNANTSDALYNTSVSPSATFTLPSTGTYTWSAQATTADGKVYTSDTWSFSISHLTGSYQADSTPHTLVPSDHAQNVCTQSTFRWTAAIGAQSYQIIVDTAQFLAFGHAFTTTVSDTSFTMPAGALRPDVAYILRIIASGTGYESDTYFSTTGPPTLLTPGDNATGVGTTPTLTWSAQACTSVYTVSIYTQRNPNIFTRQVTGTSLTVPASVLISGETYQWSVRAAGDNVYLSQSSFTP